jgi:tRNA (cytidine/uridine-2'-O-)-methyltransferase
MFEIALFEPEIPPNTGNIMRLCANTGCRLHLIEPLGFWLDHRQLRRAGLDYRDRAAVVVHRGWNEWQEWCGNRFRFVFTTQAARGYHETHYEPRSALLFGPETRPMPEEVLETFGPEMRLRLPMVPGSRSLNLANAVSVVVYEAWRQLGFPGASV